jgi:hypothetical protein
MPSPGQDLKKSGEETMDRKVRFVRVWLVVAAALVLFAANASAAVSKQYMQNMYSQFLRSEGYMPELDKDGDVLFKVEGLIYFIQVFEDDPEHFRLVLANIWPVKSEYEKQQVLAAANHANTRSKAAKITLVDDNVWVSIEQFVAQPEDFKATFRRCLSALQNGMRTFVNKMREGR